MYREIVYDNLKSAVAKFVGRNYKKPTDELVEEVEKSRCFIEEVNKLKVVACGNWF